MLTAFLVSVAAIAIGEIGDKTQLLALMLAARYRQPWPIVAGILCATLANHALAGIFGSWVRHAVDPGILRYAIALALFAVAVWALKPDKLDAHDAKASRLGVFAVTTVAFFLAEMGDKTQLATVALAARFSDLPSVVAGTTAGLLLADAPVVWLGDLLSRRLPMQWLHRVAALLMALMGVLALLNVGSVFD
jgi:putative Ca2+/H+ antiporter (TMEM165/GDT1 family)